MEGNRIQTDEGKKEGNGEGAMQKTGSKEWINNSKKKKSEIKLRSKLVLDTVLSTDLLGRLQLWSVATQIIKLSSLPAVSSLNQVNTKGGLGRVTRPRPPFVVGSGGRLKGIKSAYYNNIINTGISNWKVSQVLQYRYILLQKRCQPWRKPQRILEK